MEGINLPVEASPDSNIAASNGGREMSFKEEVLLEFTHQPEESIDLSREDVWKMNEQLREIHKEVTEGWNEKGQKMAASYDPHPGELDPDDNTVYRQALDCVPQHVMDIKYLYQTKISELLNVERDDKNDYRLIADHLGFSSNAIHLLSKAKDPMMSVFENTGRKPGKEFVDALYKCRRFDVMRLLNEFYFRAELRQSISHEEKRKQLKATSLVGSLEEKLFAQERKNRASSDPVEQAAGSPPKSSAGHEIHVTSTAHDEHSMSDDDDDWQGAVPGAKAFWDQIKGEKGFNKKKLRYIKRSFKELFEKDSYKSEFPYTWKLIVHTMKLDSAADGDTFVSPENFQRMLAFFGPPTANDDGCIKTAGNLRKCSLRSVKQGSKERISWFAGVMKEDEAVRYLDNKDRGSYLVRFSTSCADNGWYVLAIKTENSGVAQFQIKQSREKGRKNFNIIGHEEKVFDNLWTLVEYYEVIEIKDEDQEVDEYLVSVCPGLPLNEICSGYKKAAKKRK